MEVSEFSNVMKSTHETTNLEYAFFLEGQVPVSHVQHVSYHTTCVSKNLTGPGYLIPQSRAFPKRPCLLGMLLWGAVLGA